jgi:hypothetical protein
MVQKLKSKFSPLPPPTIPVFPIFQPFLCALQKGAKESTTPQKKVMDLKSITFFSNNGNITF